MAQSGAAGVMIGRGSYGRPWFCAQVIEYLKTGAPAPLPNTAQMMETVLGHYEEMLSLYGINEGVKVARKHIGWYLAGLPGGAEIRQIMNAIDEPEQQIAAIDRFFAGLIDGEAAVSRQAA